MTAYPRTLVNATNLDVLPADKVIERRDDHFVVRTPSNPQFYSGNFLLFDEPPDAGDGERWEALFDEAFAYEPRVRHRKFTWDTAQCPFGLARKELEPRGYELDESVGLVAEALHPHDRENREVEIHALDPFGDEELWHGILELQIANRDLVFSDAASYRSFTAARQADQRELFRAGRGTWYAAIEPEACEVVGSCGIVVTDRRGRYQAVDTAEAHRRRGICSRLVVEASRLSTEAFGTERFVIVADAGYHALGLYESLGFERRERVVEALLRPPRGRTITP